MPQDEKVGLPLDQVTVADMLKKGGYFTGAVGKWHLGAHPSFHPNRRGFDAYFGLLGGGRQYFDHNQFLTNPTKAREEYFIPLMRNQKSVEEKEYLTDALGREAVSFVKNHQKEPFFLYLAFNAPHTPLQAPETYKMRVQAIKNEKRRLYAAMVCALDDAVGRVMAALKEQQLTEKTLVFFFSDNGGPVSVTQCRNSPLRGEKGQIYEGGIRVPYVISWPGIVKPGYLDQPASSLDVVPTVLAAAGMDAPQGVNLDGVNLIPHLKDEAKQALVDRSLFWRTNGGPNAAIRKGPYKLVKRGDKPHELFDLSRDLGEKDDLFTQKVEVANALKKELEAWNDTLVPPRWAPLNAASPAKGKK